MPLSAVQISSGVKNLIALYGFYSETLPGGMEKLLNMILDSGHGCPLQPCGGGLKKTRMQCTTTFSHFAFRITGFSRKDTARVALLFCPTKEKLYSRWFITQLPVEFKIIAAICESCRRNEKMHLFAYAVLGLE